MHHCVSRATLIVALVASLAFLPTAATAAPQPIEFEVYSSHVEFFPNADWYTAHLTIGGVECKNVNFSFRRGERIVFVPKDELGKPLPDGVYTFDLTLRPEKFERPVNMQAGGDANLCRGIEDLPPLEVLTLAGYVTLRGGKFADPRMEEDGNFQAPASNNGIDATSAPIFASTNGTIDGSGQIPMSAADELILDDLIVDGSACIGFDCVNGESFGFDTIRLKENNLRIKFDDTSVAASFPRTDWQLTANASANGGASKFSIDDISGGPHPVHRRGERTQPLALRRRRRPPRHPHLDPEHRDPCHRRRHPDAASAAGRQLRLRAADLGRGRQRDQLLRPRREQRLDAALPRPPRCADQLGVHRR